MPTLVADASALVSLGITAGTDPDPLAIAFDTYDVVAPTAVVDELRDLSTYDDVHGTAAATVLDRLDSVTVRSVSLDTDFPLDDGENAAVTLANELDAALLLCDEFTHLGLIHASLADTRLVTTPTILSVFVRQERVAAGDARRLLETISAARSWDSNSYVHRARALLEDPSE